MKKTFNFYRKKIYPKISSLRGTHRLKIFLEKLALLDMSKVDEQPDDVFEREWDNLLILDACRHDLYEEVKGETEYRITKGSSSPSFITENFSEGDFSDVVYVTGNPFFNESQFKDLTNGRKPDEVFHEVFHTYLTDWDDKQGTVLPKPLIRDAKTAKNLFPNKRIVVHFMQPHHPFIDSDIEDIGAHPENEGSEKVWSKAERGIYTQAKVWEEYKKNLEFICEEISELSKNLGGKTVVTSDHGNLVGEKGFYGHNFNSAVESLRKVPWDVDGDKVE